jgi:hypothetical protein
MDTLAYINNKFHAFCAKCSVCSTPLVSHGMINSLYVCLHPRHDLPKSSETFYCRPHFEALDRDPAEVVCKERREEGERREEVGKEEEGEGKGRRGGEWRKLKQK